MFFYRTPVTGNLLPERTLCLTYDDGPGVTSTPMPAPGPRTDDLAFYLFQQGIPATFFVVGNQAASQPELCLQLTRWGHLVVNHTQTHNGLPRESPAKMIADVVDAALSIGAATNPDSLLLRPPYGAWSNDVASALNGDPEARKVTGPITWDIDCNDWNCWDQGLSPQACADNCYNQITNNRKGIVLMHDCAPSSDPVLAGKNQTYEMIQLLIPRLIADGYRFIRLDAVPQVRSAMQVNSIAGLKAISGYVSPQGGGGGSILANGPGLSAWEELGLIELAGGKVGIRTPNGQFMSTQPNGEVLANGNGAYDWEVFELLDQGNGLVALLAHTGKYVSAPNAGQILATATTVGPSEQFILEYVAQ